MQQIGAKIEYAIGFRGWFEVIQVQDLFFL